MNDDCNEKLFKSVEALLLSLDERCNLKTFEIDFLKVSLSTHKMNRSNPLHFDNVNHTKITNRIIKRYLFL